MCDGVLSRIKTLEITNQNFATGKRNQLMYSKLYFEHSNANIEYVDDVFQPVIAVRTARASTEAFVYVAV